MISVYQELPCWLQLLLTLVPTFSAIFAAGALVLNIRQSQRTNKQARLELVAECLSGFANNDDIQKAFYAIEYGEFKYDEHFHNSSTEQQIDKLLRHFANLALSWEAGLLSTNDVKPVQYYVLRILKNSEVTNYLNFIASWSERATNGRHPYIVLQRLAKELSCQYP